MEIHTSIAKIYELLSWQEKGKVTEDDLVLISLGLNCIVDGQLKCHVRSTSLHDSLPTGLAVKLERTHLPCK